MTVKSYLFVPGHQVSRFDKAIASGAHAVILDLEDAVPPAQKDEARSSIANWLNEESHVIVRANPRGSPWFEDDLRACRRPGVFGVVLPKSESSEDVEHAGRILNAGQKMYPLIETAMGLSNALEIGRVNGVDRLMFGSIDFQLDIGLEDEELVYYRSHLVWVSRLAQLPGPVDGVTTAVDDPERVTRDALRARRSGFSGKLCIHPKQVSAVNAAFRPTDAEIEWATRVVEADASAAGAATVLDGKMIDRPVLLKAHRVLTEAKT